jgi:hypothetical protein
MTKPIATGSSQTTRYRVKGWKIVALRNGNATVNHWDNVRDVSFEIEFDREDPTSIEEVFRHPLSAEVDDYAEYKRLRRCHHDPKFSLQHGNVDDMHTPTHERGLPLATYMSASPPLFSRATTFRSSGANGLPSNRLSPQSSASTRSGINEKVDDSITHAKQKPQLISSPTTIRRASFQAKKLEAYESDAKDFSSQAYSPHIQQVQAPQLLDIKEVAPWLESDQELDKHAPMSPRVRLSPRVSRLMHGRTAISFTNAHDHTPQNPKIVGDGQGHHKSISALRTKTSQRVIARSHNPLAKLFDGVKDEEVASTKGCLSSQTDTAGTKEAMRLSLKQPIPAIKKWRANSTSEGGRMMSPVLFRPLRRTSTWIRDRRSEILVPLSDSLLLEGSHDLDDPFVRSRSLISSSVALQAFISGPRTAAPIEISPPASPSPRTRTSSEQQRFVVSSPAAMSLKAFNEGRQKFKNSPEADTSDGAGWQLGAHSSQPRLRGKLQ